MSNCEYKRLKPFKWFVLQNFPFIDEDFDAITNYELLCKVIEYLNNTIEKTNELGSQVETLVNWFNNLDVQDEVDKKLDEMTEDGTLAKIINQEIFNNLNEEIQQNKTDISTINSNITSIEENIDDIEEQINQTDKIVMFGDSYARGSLGGRANNYIMVPKSCKINE